MVTRKLIVTMIVFLLMSTIAAKPKGRLHYDFSEVDSYLRKQASLKKSKWNGYPAGRVYPDGLSLIVMKDGEILYDQSYGGMTSESVIPFASGSKWLAGITVMKSIDDGFLTLDTKTEDVLPYFSGDKGKATLRHLFTHSAGYPADDPLCLNFDITLEECVRGLSNIQLLSLPGEKLRYSSVSMQIGARMVEVATGEDWQTYFYKNVALPLNMKNTDWKAHLETKNPRIAGAIQSTGKDYIQFLHMLLNHGIYKKRQYISRNTIDILLKDQTMNAEIESMWQNYRYGIGCFMEKMDEENNGVVVSHPGSIGVAPWIDRSRGVACVLSASCGFNDTQEVYWVLQKLVEKALDNPK
ncbi:MAG: serine hydrolase [Caldisericia bacterium]|nr:serine hydrolase [Caldisericia bacterium]